MDTRQSPRRRRRMPLPTTLGGIFTVVALALAGVTTASPAAAATGQITGIGGKCVDVAAASSANGTPIQLYDCNGSAAQQWTRNGDGTVRALGKCLDVTAASTANGAQIQLYDCNG
ncbi:ricin-type beta-trefoil lectin domain protein, partial [Streptosporangium sp. NPDC048865]|uniref:ricin-type beta-trefoil lectin domain protein n=1 Tax=Streptosporangium sp. NPDC048865 TaxID=3155766 RepID=UPI0034216BBD